MKCIKCLTKNINEANYCKNCGYKFDDREREAAKRWTPVWILEKIEKFIKIIKGEFDFLSFITDTLVYKIISILVVLAIGIGMCLSDGRELKIKESPNYDIQYSDEEKEYYLFIKEKETTLDLYVPGNVEKITLKHLDYKDKLIEEQSITGTDDITVKVNDEDYYILSAHQGEKDIEFKVLVFLGRSE